MVEFPRQLKKTKQRVDILKILDQQSNPITAEELIKLAAEEGMSMTISTVTRTLASFVKAGIINEYHMSVNEGKAYEMRKEKHRHYAICLRCRKKIPLSTCPMPEHIPELENIGFSTTEHHIEIFGYCKNCSIIKNM